MLALPPVGVARSCPQTTHLTTVLAFSKMVCSFSQSGHFTFKNLLRFSRISLYHVRSLRQFELCDTVSLAQVCFSAGDTAVPDVDLLRRLVATGHLREFAHVAYFAPACLLAVDPVEAGCLAFLYLLDLMDLVFRQKGQYVVNFAGIFIKFHR